MSNARAWAIVLAIIAAIGVVSSAPARAAGTGSIALTGQVSSKEEGPMEGVLVSVKKAGSTITTTVASDQQGRYRFPASKIGPGSYSLRIRAVGYELDGSGAVEVVSKKTTTADLKLRTTSDVASQLTNAEWLMSFPGTEEQKASIRGCTHCHTLERVVRSKHNAAEFMKVLERMSRYTPQSFPLFIQSRGGGGRIGGGTPSPEQQARRQEARGRQAEYLSSLNLSLSPQWSYSLKTSPRPKGRATQVIYTEYDLPKPTRQPHDVIVDSQGFAWFASFGEPILGKMDPKTGKVTEYPVPVLKPGFIAATLDLEFDKDENPWLAMTFQAAVAKFDRKTEKFQVYSLPPELNGDYREFTFLSPTHSHVDGKVWINDSGTWTQLRLDIASGKFEVFETSPIPRPNTYQMSSDSHNNGFFTVFGREDIGKIDAKSGKVTFYKTPTSHSAPRRGDMDSQDRFWFGENSANRIGMFDTRTEKFQEWAVSVPEYWPYDVVSDKNGEAWAVTEFADSVLRFNPTTGQFTGYLLPRETNGRRAFVDNSTTPVTFWVGNTHGGSIVKLEPVEPLE